MPKFTKLGVTQRFFCPWQHPYLPTAELSFDWETLVTHNLFQLLHACALHEPDMIADVVPDVLPSVRPAGIALSLIHI